MYTTVCWRALSIIALVLSLACSRDLLVDSNHVIVGVESYPENLDPRVSVDALSSKLNKLLYNGLFQLNAQLEVVPDLAARYEYQSDTVIHIGLRKDVFFHNGQKLTAHDVVATYLSIQNPQLKSPRRFVYQNIKDITALDDYQLTIVLKEPFSPIMTSLTLPILPRSVCEGEFQSIGTGPYRLERVVESEKIILKRFDAFFGAKAANQQLIFRTIYDDTLRTLELIKGRLHLVQNAIPPVLLASLAKTNPALKVSSEPGINLTYMGFNLKDPILKHAKVRQAIAMAINRDEIIRYKLKGLAAVADSLLSPNHWSYRSYKTYPYNVTKAKRLLDAAGFKDPDGNGPQPRFKLVYKTSTKKDRVELALLMAQQLSAIGIEVEVKSYEWGTFFRDIRTGNFQMYTLTWVGISEPDMYYYVYHSGQVPPHGANRGFYHNRLVDQWTEKARRVSDISKRRQLYSRVQQVLSRELPSIPLWYEHNWVAYDERVTGYRLRPDGGFQSLVSSVLEE